MFLLPLFESQDVLSLFSHCLVETAELGFYRFFLKGLEPASEFQLKCCLGLSNLLFSDINSSHAVFFNFSFAHLNGKPCHQQLVIGPLCAIMIGASSSTC